MGQTPESSTCWILIPDSCVCAGLRDRRCVIREKSGLHAERQSAYVIDYDQTETDNKKPQKLTSHFNNASKSRIIQYSSEVNIVKTAFTIRETLNIPEICHSPSSKINKIVKTFASKTNQEAFWQAWGNSPGELLLVGY
ncbi:hypothetical protein CEXT_360231 [Caerostris extrusa]|uniref:Uncharacterized protein n=1 Tax=Caerostris extrusa TaxID=172846 RepID=A0AAV4VYH1_CAEEX|nr:hypothetical protein CEXT_360231 [Caerostris extrusa]